MPCGFLSLIFKCCYGIPYVVSLRGADVPGYTDRFTFVYKILTPFIRLIWKKAGAVISNSDGLRDLALETNSRQKIGVIYNGVDTEKFCSDEGKKVSQSFKILCISRLTGRKGINYLIGAMKLISGKYPSAKLKIVGDGDAKTDLEKQAKELGIGDKVDFQGRIRHDKLPNIYANSHVFVLPSLNEGMSNTMLEALAAGLPIVATDTGGTKELVRDGENGSIVRMKDEKDIADKIGKLIDDQELREKMSRKSRQRAEELSWKNVANEYVEVYKRITEKKN